MCFSNSAAVGRQYLFLPATLCWLLQAGALRLINLLELVLVHNRPRIIKALSPISSPIRWLMRSQIVLEVSSAPSKFLSELRHRLLVNCNLRRQVRFAYLLVSGQSSASVFDGL